jgi:septal ring-binding cell division protein DamX
LAAGKKASQVASKLQQAPKSNRRAQVKYQRNGQNYYKGVYGSYSSYQAAQQALNSLPANVRQGAKIKSWGSVQSSVRSY